VHPKTVRRWIASGRLRAVRRGRVYRIDPSDLAPFMEQDGTEDGEHSGPSGQDAPGAPGIPGMERPEVSGLIEALRLVEKLQQQNLELAGRVGFYQAQVEQLRQQLALAAPASPEPTPDAAATSAAATRPWWRFWS
jgi:excisionase family DNA binding protein